MSNHSFLSTNNNPYKNSPNKNLLTLINRKKGAMLFANKAAVNALVREINNLRRKLRARQNARSRANRRPVKKM